MRTPRTPRSTGPARGPGPSAKRKLSFGPPPRSKGFRNFNAVSGNRMATTPGFPLGGKTSKTHYVPDVKALGPIEIRAVLIDNISKGTGINQRERDICHLKGWKVRFQVHSTILFPLTMRFALISPRQTFGTTPTTQAIGLLRGYGPSRSLGLNVGNSGLTNTQNPINEDLYMILYSNKTDVGPPPSTAGYTGGVKANWASFDQWVPLNKQLRYDASTSGKSETPIYLVYWYDTKDRAAGAPFTTSGGVNVNVDSIAYFHDRN